MGFNNPSWTWKELEAALSGRRAGGEQTKRRDGRAPGSPSWNAGGDGPAWSRKRQPFEATASSGAPAQCPTPSCTATPTSASSTAPPTPRSWPRRRPGSAWRRWPSPTTTASTAWCASPRRPGPSGCPRCSAPSSPCTASDTELAVPRGQCADPARTTTWSCWPTARRATPAWPGPSARASWRGRRARPGSRWPTSADARPGTGWCSPGAARGRCPPRWSADGPAAAAPGAAPAGRAVRARPRARSSCGTTATRSTRPATTPWPSWRPAPAWPASPPTTSTTPRPAQRPLATALAAVRARRSLDELDGWLPAAGRRPPALGGRAGPALRPLPRRGRAGGRARPGLPPSTWRWWPRAAAVPVPRRATPRCVPAPSWSRRARAPPLRAAARRPGPVAVGARSTTSSTSSSSSASPATSSSCGTSSSSAAKADIYCQGRGSAANSAVCYALGITNADAVALGLLFERFLSPERDGPPDIDLDIESDRREEAIQYVYDALRPRPHRPGGQRHHLPGPLGGARHGQGARLRPRPAGRLVQAGRRLGAGWQVTGRAERPDHDIPASVLELAARGRGLPPPPRHPLRRHGDLRPAGDRGVPGGVGAHGGPQRPAVGQGRLRRRRAW